MNIKEKFSNLIKNELIYSIICIIMVSGFLLFGILYFIPKYNIFAYFFLQLFFTLVLLFFYYIKYGSFKSKIKIDEKYYTMQIRRLNEQMMNGYIDEEQYKERVKEFENRLKK